MRKIVLSCLVVFSVFGFMSRMYVLADTSTTTSTSTTTVVATTSTTTQVVKPVHNAKEVEVQVRDYFKDTPVMVDIARCESKFRQYTDGGNVFMGGYGGGMVGIFQIYRDVHKNAASALGLDINTIEGNLAYARHLYRQSGTGPWISSMPCWNTDPVPEQVVVSSAPSVAPITNGTLTTNLIFGMEHPQVLVLQKILNQSGFTIAQSGPGSVGNETTKFGALTRSAVRAFQCKQNIVCSGDEYSTAYGLVGPRTRQVLLQVAGSSSVINNNPNTTTNSSDERTATIRNQIADIQQQIANLQKQLAELQKQLNQ